MRYKRVVITKFGGPTVLEVVEEPDLPEPKDGEVRVRVLATSAAFTDTLIRRGMYPDVRKKPPFSPGYDMVGIVDKVGPGAAEFTHGDKVAALTVVGSYSQYLCLPERELVQVPDELDAAEAVSLILSYVTAYQMLTRSAGIKRGQTILVHGAAGAVGTAMLQLGKDMDLKMFGTASKPKHALVEQLGGIPIDYRNEDFVARIRELGAAGVDAAFDPIGRQSYTRSLRAIKPGGTLVAFGFLNAATGKGGSLVMDFLCLLEYRIRLVRRSATFYSIGAWRKQHSDWFKEDLGRLFEMLAKRKIKPIIAKRMPLEQAGAAHELLDTCAVEGKIILLADADPV